MKLSVLNVCLHFIFSSKSCYLFSIKPINLFLGCIPESQIYLITDEFEDTKEVFRIRILKDRQHNDQKEKVQKDTQQSTKRKTKDRVAWTPLKPGGELRCSGMVNSSYSTSDTHRVILVTNPVIRNTWWQGREGHATSGTYPWSLVTYIFHNVNKVMVGTEKCRSDDFNFTKFGNLGLVASLLAATLHQGNPDRTHKFWNIGST